MRFALDPNKGGDPRVVHALLKIGLYTPMRIETTIHPFRVSYLIASNFYKNLSQPKSAIDQLHSKREQLNLVCPEF
jgi:hypothetical protein